MSEQRLGASMHRLTESAVDVASRGGMFLGGSSSFDKSSIPLDEKTRILRIPIPPDDSGRPVYDRNLLWPKERARLAAEHQAKVDANLRERDALLELCEHDLDARREVEALCAKDPVYWINHFVWVIDPRLGHKATLDPFVLYETQEREARFFVDEFIEAEEMLWLAEKSRAWGATWLFLALAVWGFLYRDNWMVLIGSANQKDVDAGGADSDHNSLFGKIRFLIKRLPAWQVPQGMIGNKRFDKNFSLKHPTKENALHGRQYCSNWGRSLRYTWTFSDEAAHSLNYGPASANYGNTSNRNIACSTHLGPDTEFARMVTQARDEPTYDRHLSTLFWAENPTLTADTYWGWRRKYGWEKVAQERDVDLGGSVSLAVFQTFDVNVNVVTERREVRDDEGRVLVEAREALDYTPELPLGVLVDPGMGPDPFAIIWYQIDPGAKTINLVDFCQHEGRPGPFFVPFLLGYVPAETLDKQPWNSLYEYDDVDREMIARHARWGPISEGWADRYGDSDGTRVASGRSVYETWMEYGVPYIHPIKVTNKEEAVARAAACIPRVRIAGRLLTQRTQNRQTPTLPECFKNYSWTQRESPHGLPLKRVPRHDRYCHACDAFAFLPFYAVDADDPSLMPLAPTELRDPNRKGREAVIRIPRMRLEPEESYADRRSGGETDMLGG